MPQQTVLYHEHIQLGAKMVDFAGWQMPIQYRSLLDEHHAVRKKAGMFDVSHMGVVDIEGTDAYAFLSYVLANDIGKIVEPGKAIYTCMLNHEGGILDDLIVYYIAPNFYRIVVNAGTRQKDITWFHEQAKGHDITIKERTDLAIVAVQGPEACAKVHDLLSPNDKSKLETLKNFQGTFVDDCWYARTGYTGEDGYEIILPTQKVVSLWKSLLTVGVMACGLGARDTLRLEAGLNLYGADMNESTSPLISNLKWTIALEPDSRDFIGRHAIEYQLVHDVNQQLVGLVLEEQGIMRPHQKVIVDDIGKGEITSGTFSPTIGKSIAFARVPCGDFTTCWVLIRDKHVKARVIKPPFVRKGKILI